MCSKHSKSAKCVEGAGKLDRRRRWVLDGLGVQLDGLSEGRGRVVEEEPQGGVARTGRAPLIQLRSCPFGVGIRVFWHLGERVRQAKD